MRTATPRRSADNSPWTDLLVVLGLTLLSAALCVLLDVHEWLFGLTRSWEWLQLDELPVVLLTLSAGLMWLAWRRYRVARAAETRLEAVLAENRELAQQHLRVQEDERRRLARELHDETGQYLNAIKLDAVALMSDGGAAQPAASARQIIQSVDHVYGVVSDMIRRLRPAGLDELGLAAALESCMDHWRRRLPDTHFELELGGDLDDLGETLNLTVYRLIQEGLTNCFKHSHASQIQVHVERHHAHEPGDCVTLRLKDDGGGADPQALRGGFGIGGMRERVQLLDGQFRIETAPGQGFCLHVTLPGPGQKDGEV